VRCLRSQVLLCDCDGRACYCCNLPGICRQAHRWLGYLATLLVVLSLLRNQIDSQINLVDTLLVGLPQQAVISHTKPRRSSPPAPLAQAYYCTEVFSKPALLGLATTPTPARLSLPVIIPVSAISSPKQWPHPPGLRSDISHVHV